MIDGLDAIVPPAATPPAATPPAATPPAATPPAATPPAATPPAATPPAPKHGLDAFDEGATPPADPKTAEPPPAPKEGEPIEYKINVPEGISIDEKGAKALIDWATKSKQPQAVLDEAVALHIEQVKGVVSEMLAEQKANDEAIIAANHKAIREDPKGFEKIAVVKSALAQLGEEHGEAKRLLSNTWLGTCPPILNLLSALAEKAGYKQGSVVVGGGANKEKSLANLMYPTMDQQK